MTFKRLTALVMLYTMSAHGATDRVLNATAVQNSPGLFYIPATTPTPSRVAVFGTTSVIGSSTISTGTLSFLDATSSIQAQLNAKAASGPYLIGLFSDVSATGPGTVSATVNSVGGSGASTIHTAELAANAATSQNTPNTIVLRSGTGSFNAGIINAALNGNATTATTATSFSGSLLGDVTGTQSSTVVSLVGGSTAANVHTSEVLANAATTQNTPNTIVKRSGTGSFDAGIINATLNGNATTATTATSFSGSLAGDVTGTQSATVVSSVGGSSASNVHSAEVAANAATSINTAGTIVKRSGTGSFDAGIINATLNGNAATATTATNVSGTVAIANGGTGQSTKSAAFDALSVLTTKGDLFTTANGVNSVRLAVGPDNDVVVANSTSTTGINWGTVAIAGGGTGQITKAAAFDALSPLTAKGDLILYTGSTNTRLAVGSDTTVLMRDTLATNGIKWGNPREFVNPIQSIAIGSSNVDWSLSNTFNKTLTANTTFTFSQIMAGTSITLFVTQGSAANYTVTWPGGTKFFGTAPTMTTGSNKTDAFTFIGTGATTALGTYVQNASSYP